jgi:hypothetical protein
MSRLHLDMLDGIELAEMCTLLDEWLAASPDARASYGRHIGAVDAAQDLRTALQHFAAVLTIAPVAKADR